MRLRDLNRLTRLALLLLGGLAPFAGIADPRDAERFTHIAGIDLASYPSMDELMKKFGPARVVETGDASTASSRICYLTADHAVTLEFSREEVYSGFEIRRPNARDRKCGLLQDLKESDLNIAGVRLGMSKAEFGHVAGQAAGSKKHARRHFEYKETVDGVEWQVYIELEASFRASRLASFSVDRSEQN